MIINVSQRATDGDGRFLIRLFLVLLDIYNKFLKKIISF